MKNYLFLITFCISSINISAQSLNDTIEIRKEISTVFLQNELELSPKDLLQITRSNPEAYKEMKKARLHNILSSSIGFVGGGMIGWTLGNRMVNGDTNPWLLGSGIILIGTSVGFSAGYTIHAKKAVIIFNNALRKNAPSE
jgi:lipid-binding SYLF domain-containing protein